MGITGFFTIKNLSNWFDDWEKFVINQGFASRTDDGAVVFSEHQKCHIIIIDEMNLSLNGSDGG